MVTKPFWQAEKGPDNTNGKTVRAKCFAPICIDCLPSQEWKIAQIKSNNNKIASSSEFMIHFGVYIFSAVYHCPMPFLVFSFPFCPQQIWTIQFLCVVVVAATNGNHCFDFAN